MWNRWLDYKIIWLDIRCNPRQTYISQFDQHNYNQAPPLYITTSQYQQHQSLYQSHYGIRKNNARLSDTIHSLFLVCLKYSTETLNSEINELHLLFQFEWLIFDHVSPSIINKYIFRCCKITLENKITLLENEWACNHAAFTITSSISPICKIALFVA